VLSAIRCMSERDSFADVYKSVLGTVTFTALLTEIKNQTNSISDRKVHLLFERHSLVLHKFK